MKKSRLLLFALIGVLMLLLAACSEAPPELIEPPTRILRSDIENTVARNGAVEIRKLLDERGFAMELETDWVKRGEEIPPLEGQLVIGLCDRVESEEEYDSLKSARTNSQRDWSIVESNGSILITGVSDEALGEAIAYFIENYIGEGGIEMPKGERYVYNHPYPDMSIDGKQIGEYSLISSSDVLLGGAEDYLRWFIGEYGGYTLEAENGAPISLKLDTKTTGYKIEADQSGVTVSGGTYTDVDDGVIRLCELLGAGQVDKLSESGSGEYASGVAEKSASGAYTSIGDPIWLIDDITNMNSGWDRLFTTIEHQKSMNFASRHDSVFAMTNAGVVEPCYAKRVFNEQSDGILVLDTEMNFTTYNGGKLEIYGEDGCAVLLTVRDNVIFANDSEKLVASPWMRLRLIIDLDSGKYTVCINGKDCGSFDFYQKVGSLDTLKVSLDENANNTVWMSYVSLYKNIPLMERFNVTSTGNAPLGFEVEGSCAVTGSSDANLTGEASMSKGFKAFDGCAIFETKLLVSDFFGAEVSLMSGDKAAMTLRFDDMSIYAGDERLRSYSRNMWYILRIVADTRTGLAEIKINGKSLGWFALENAADKFDGVRIVSKGGSVRVDDMMVYQYNEHDDYVPAPLSAGSDGYYVAAQVCSLWRNGYHWGWDRISPYDELRPVLGYYDEGIVELADWEIKYMAEHGVDYQLYCWYSTEVDQPIKNPAMNEALHEGYFNAKYSDQIKFAIMWENANATHPGSSENFRNVIVPYWVEYYLTDPRYMTIDNKPVITVFSVGDLIKDFGSAEKVKEEFDYLREVCRGLGYDGALIFCQAASTDSGTLNKIKAFGADAVYAYNWGKSNTSSAYINNVSNQYKNGNDTIATISVGFNNVGWAGTRSELIEPDDYKTALEWVRDTFSENYDEDSWLSRAVVLSTWNEYGEGTYIMPSNLHGFDYLDAVREVFAPDNEYENIVPTDDQLARIGTLYPQDRKLLRAEYRLDPTEYDKLDVVKSWTFENGASGWTQGFGLSDFSVSDGTIKGASNVSDFAIYSQDNLGISLDNVDVIHVRMKCDNSGGLQIFYVTNDNTGYNESMSVHASVRKSDDFVDYYISTGTVSATFNGTLKQLRFDPLSSSCSFEIEAIELLGTLKTTVLVNGENEMTFGTYKPREVDGCMLAPFDPKTGMMTFIGCGYEWDANTSTLTVLHRDDSMTFTVGSDLSLVNGREVKLSHEVTSLDGLPMLPINDLIRELGLDGVALTEKSNS